MKTGDTFERIYRVVRSIPQGSVMTYGQVAELAGMPRAARVAGYAMAAAPEDVPWQRVVGKSRKNRARITLRDSLTADIQRQLLEGEGIEFDGGEIDLERFGAVQP